MKHFFYILTVILFSLQSTAQNKYNIIIGGIDGSVPSSRTLTINGVTYDLGANRSWTVGNQIAYPNIADRFHTGYGTFGLFGDTVRSTVLTGLSTATATAVTSSDNILSGMGKLQGQINANTSAITSNTSAVAGKQAQLNGTGYVKQSGTTTSYSSTIPYSDLTGTPATSPSVYFSPAQSLNPAFMVFASAILRPTGTQTHGQPITWSILNQTDGHNSSFITSAAGNVNGFLQVNYPTVKHVVNLTVTPDETLAGYGVSCGPTVDFNNAQIAISVPSHLTVKLTGNGSGGWTKSGVVSSAFDVTSFSTGDGGTSFNIQPSGPSSYDYQTALISYNGPNRYSVRRVYSGLGAYNVRFVLIDAAGNPLATNPTTSDEVVISNMGIAPRKILANNWSTTTNGENNHIFSALSNFWIFGTFEAYMVASPVSSTSVQVRFQSYPSATSYKIYRATDAAFTSPVLIYNGNTTNGTASVVDGGLTANTLYHYKMVAVVSGVDTEVTTFRANTYF